MTGFFPAIFGGRGGKEFVPVYTPNLPQHPESVFSGTYYKITYGYALNRDKGGVLAVTGVVGKLGMLGLVPFFSDFLNIPQNAIFIAEITHAEETGLPNDFVQTYYRKLVLKTGAEKQFAFQIPEGKVHGICFTDYARAVQQLAHPKKASNLLSSAGLHLTPQNYTSLVAPFTNLR